nr:MAG TPA: hypothetical protein [Caudoviricetes sp.]
MGLNFNGGLVISSPRKDKAVWLLRLFRRLRPRRFVIRNIRFLNLEG